MVTQIVCCETWTLLCLSLCVYVFVCLFVCVMLDQESMHANYELVAMLCLAS